MHDDFELITRRLCLIKDTGHAGVRWGGNMMAWVDEAGAIYRLRRADTRFGFYVASYQHGGLIGAFPFADPNNPGEACSWRAPACFDGAASGGNPPDSVIT